MAPVNDPPPTAVRISRLVPAPREEVFEAWLNPEIRRRWWRPAGKGTKCLECDIESRVGGEFRTVATNPDKTAGCCNFGKFLEIVRPRRLVFTWSSGIAEDAVHDTLVTVEFHDRSGETLVLVTHEKLPTPDQGDAHREGWTRLLRYLEKELRKSKRATR